MSWKGDKSEDFTCKDNYVEYTGPEPNQSIIFNAIYSEEAKIGENYWEITIDKGRGVSVGLTTKELFKPGYKLRAACYNGNLTNASGSKVTGFGPVCQPGEVVGILADVSADKVIIYIYVNGSCYGPAFSVPAPEGKLQPCVSLRAPGDKVHIVSKPPPKERTRNDTPGPFPEGSWILSKFDGEAQSFDVELTFQAQPNNALGMTSKIVNTLRTSLESKGGDAYKSSGRVVSTMMAGPEPQMQFETHFTEFMEGIESIKESASGAVIKSSNGKSAEVSRRVLSFEPVTEDVFKSA